MFKLIKLGIYALVGYALYEFFRGVTTGDSGEEGGEGRSFDRSSEFGSRRANMTGPARGNRVTTSEPSGESVPHTVGRGVVH